VGGLINLLQLLQFRINGFALYFVIFLLLLQLNLVVCGCVKTVSFNELIKLFCAVHWFMLTRSCIVSDNNKNDTIDTDCQCLTTRYNYST